MRSPGRVLPADALVWTPFVATVNTRFSLWRCGTCDAVLQLAVAQLDCKKRDEDLDRERLRVEALKWKLVAQRSAELDS